MEDGDHIQQIPSQFLRDVGLAGRFRVVPTDPATTSSDIASDAVRGDGGSTEWDGQNLFIKRTLPGGARVHMFSERTLPGGARFHMSFL